LLKALAGSPEGATASGAIGGAVMTGIAVGVSWSVTAMSPFGTFETCRPF
jgi:hypothetical protein